MCVNYESVAVMSPVGSLLKKVITWLLRSTAARCIRALLLSLGRALTASEQNQDNGPEGKVSHTGAISMHDGSD